MDSESCHRDALRPCRAADDRQRHPPPGRPVVLCVVSRAALSVPCVVEAPGTAVNVFFLLPFVAGSFSLLLAAINLFRPRLSSAAWCFSIGMVALGLDSVFTGLSLRATQLGEVVEWLTPAFIAKSFVPVAWLG